MIPDPYQPPADLLASRVILVTGAGQGLGRARMPHIEWLS